MVSDFPEVVKEWHPSKNDGLTPEKVSAGSSKKIWWKCNKGPDHEWKTKINHRTGDKQSGCPYCIGLKVSVTNSLATQCDTHERETFEVVLAETETEETKRTRKYGNFSKINHRNVLLHLIKIHVLKYCN